MAVPRAAMSRTAGIRNTIGLPFLSREHTRCSRPFLQSIDQQRLAHFTVSAYHRDFVI